MNQRWRDRRTSYRPAEEVINTSQYEVAAIPGDTEAKTFVATHHYSHSYPAARFRFGLYRHGALDGVAVFSTPCHERVLTNVFPVEVSLAAELGRFVLLDSVPGNGETWFLARCFELLRREDLVGIVSFSDPLPRRTVGGDIVHKGHIGTIYQAFNGVYLGRSTPRTIHLLPDGSVLSARTIQKIRARERGWKYGVTILQRYGASEAVDEDIQAWLTYWLPRLTRTARHPGNHKYAWALHKAAAKLIPHGFAYPKLPSSLFS